jgi:hypothetical protein
MNNRKWAATQPLQSWHCDCGGTIEIDPCRPQAEKDLLKSGAVFWFETFDTVADGTTCGFNGIDGYPGSIYATSDERGYSNSADYLHNRKAFWHPAGGWIDGERLPVPQDARE